MAIKLSSNEICQAAEVFAKKMLEGENAEHRALSVLEHIKKNTPEQIALIMICEFGAPQAERVAELMVEKVRARKNNGS